MTDALTLNAIHDAALDSVRGTSREQTVQERFLLQLRARGFDVVPSSPALRKLHASADAYDHCAKIAGDLAASAPSNWVRLHVMEVATAIRKAHP